MRLLWAYVVLLIAFATAVVFAQNPGDYNTPAHIACNPLDSDIAYARCIVEFESQQTRNDIESIRALVRDMQQDREPMPEISEGDIKSEEREEICESTKIFIDANPNMFKPAGPSGNSGSIYFWRDWRRRIGCDKTDY